MKRRHLLALSTTALAFASVRRSWAQESTSLSPPSSSTRCWRPSRSIPMRLLAQVLMAATYPLEVVEAARWSQANPNLKGDAAVAAVKDKSWDVSVKSLTAFPQVLAMMNGKLDWTQKVGDAMIGQQKEVAEFDPAAARQGRRRRQPQEQQPAEGHDPAGAIRRRQRDRDRAGQPRTRSTSRTTIRTGPTVRGPIRPIRRSTIRRRRTMAPLWRPA